MQKSNILKRYEALSNMQFLHDKSLPNDCIEPDLRNIDLKDVEVLFVLGLTSKISAFRSYLEKPTSRLVFVEDDIAKIRSLIGNKELEDLFLNSRVELKFMHQIDEICFYASSHKTEVLDLDSSSKQLRQKFIEKQIQIRNTLDNHLCFLSIFQNLLSNYSVVNEAFKISGFKGSLSNYPVVVCGAGPSIELNRKDLLDLKRRALIFAVGTGICALKKLGIDPDFFLATDPNNDEFERLKSLKGSKTTLIYTTRLHHKVESLFSGAKIFLPLDESSSLEEYLNTRFKLSDNSIFPKNESFFENSSTAVHACISVLQFMGVKKIFFSGFDFCLANSKRYMNGVYCKNRLEKEASNEKGFLRSGCVNVQNIRGQPVESSWHFLSEKKVVEQFIDYYKHIEFYNLSKIGLCIKGAKTFCDEDMKGLNYIDFITEKFFHNFGVEIALDKKKFRGEIDNIISSLKRCLEILHILSRSQCSNAKKIVYNMNLKDEHAYKLCLQDTFNAYYVQSGCKKNTFYKDMILLVEQYLLFLL